MAASSRDPPRGVLAAVLGTGTIALIVGGARQRLSCRGRALSVLGRKPDILGGSHRLLTDQMKTGFDKIVPDPCYAGRLGFLHLAHSDMGLTGDEVAERLPWSTAKVSRIENARTGAKITDVRRLLDLYDIDGARHKDLVSLAHDAAQRGWWKDYRNLPSPLADFIVLKSEATADRNGAAPSFRGCCRRRDARAISSPIGAPSPPCLRRNWNAGWAREYGARFCWTR